MNDRDYVYKIILSDCQTVKIWEKNDMPEGKLSHVLNIILIYL